MLKWASTPAKRLNSNALGSDGKKLLLAATERSHGDPLDWANTTERTFDGLRGECMKKRGYLDRMRFGTTFVPGAA